MTNPGIVGPATPQRAVTDSGILVAGKTYQRGDLITHGAPAGLGAVGAYYDPKTHLYGNPELALRRFRSALARSKTGGAVARLHSYGDSITEALGILDNTRNTTAWPEVLRLMLNGLWCPTYEGPIWPTNSNQVSTGWPGDARITLGTGWGQNGSLGLGGQCLVSAGAGASPTSFGPVTCDSFKYNYYNLGGAFTWSIDGAVSGAGFGTVTPGSDLSLQTLTLGPSAVGSVGSHTLTITPHATAGDHMACFEYSTSTNSGGLYCSRGGAGGSTAAAWSADTGNTSSMHAAFDLVVPDLTILMLCTNDQNGGTSPLTYRANMDAIVARAQAAGSDVILAPDPPQQNNQLVPTSAYRDQLYSIADARGCLVLDTLRAWVSWSASSAAPYSLYGTGTPDSQHPSKKGNAELGYLFYNALRNVV